MAITIHDNGVHEYVENDDYLIIRNHGERRWTGMLKVGGGYRLMGQRDIVKGHGFHVGYSVPTFATAEAAVAFARKAAKAR